MSGNMGMRLWGLVRKESFQIMRDPSSIAIAFFMPVLLLLLHGYGVSLNAKNVKIGFVATRSDEASASLLAAFSGSAYFDVQQYLSVREAEDAQNLHRIKGFVHLQDNFADLLHTGATPPIRLVLNGVDANTARLVSGYAEGVWMNWLKSWTGKTGKKIEMPAQLHHRVWFNSRMRSRDFLVPGLIAVNMTLIGALLTAMVMAREWERGTMEALMVTPVSMAEVIAGKLIPYFVMGMGGMGISLAMARFLFDVPLRGSLAVLVVVSAIFLLVALGIGLLISIAAKNQFTAGQIAIIATFLPAFLLSGYIFDISAMPVPIQAVTFLVAARYFIAVLQTIFLAGTVWQVILANTAALVIMACIFLFLCFYKSEKRLE